MPFDEESLTKINVDVGSENYLKVGSVLDFGVALLSCRNTTYENDHPLFL